MQALTSYQSAHDTEYERACARDDAIDRAFWSIVADKADFVDQVEQMIQRDDIQPAELIAYLYAARMDARACPDWHRRSLLEYVQRGLETNINEALKREATARVDAREEV